MRVACQNCNWIDIEEHAKPARDIGSRHDLGDRYSDLECPECGALCFPCEDTPTRSKEKRGIVEKHKILYKDLKQYRVKTGEEDGVYACRLYKGQSKKPVAVYPSLCDLVVALGPYQLHIQGDSLERNGK